MEIGAGAELSVILCSDLIVAGLPRWACVLQVTHFVFALKFWRAMILEYESDNELANLVHVAYVAQLVQPAQLPPPLPHPDNTATLLFEWHRLMGITA